MERLVGWPRLFTILCPLVRRKRVANREHVVVRVPVGGRASDQAFDERAQVEQLLELRPVWDECPPHSRGRSRRPAAANIGAAVTAADDLDVSGAGEPVKRFAHRSATNGKHLRELTLRRETLAWHELAEGDGGDQAVGDVLG